MKRIIPFFLGCLSLTACQHTKTYQPISHIDMDDTLILNIDSIFGTGEFPSKEEMNKMGNVFYQTESDGWADTYPGWYVQEKIKAVATDKELCSMVRFSTVPALRAFAFSVLAEKHHQACFDIVCAGIMDTATFASSSFDLIWGWNVAEYMIGASLSDSIFSPQQLFQLDSLIAFTPGLSHLDFQVLSSVCRLSDTLEMYDRIRELYLEGHDNMLVELAQYKKESDKDLFIAALKQYKNGAFVLNSVKEYDNY